MAGKPKILERESMVTNLTQAKQERDKRPLPSLPLFWFCHLPVTGSSPRRSTNTGLVWAEIESAMFYSHFILAKKGPLGTVWIAAHLERKLRKNQVTETNISASVDSIMYPEVPIALRLSGHLLLGVVRIYSKKVNYLYQDCSEALVKIKQVFYTVHVDLPPTATSAPFHSITLPETFEFDEMEQEELRYTRDVIPDTHVTTHDQITLSDYLREQVPGAGDPYTMFYVDEEPQRHRSPAHPAIPSLEEDVLPPLPMDGTMGLDQMDIEINGLEEAARVPAEVSHPEDVPERETLRAAVQASIQEPYLVGMEELGKDIDIGGDTEGPRMEETQEPILEETPVLGGEIPSFDFGPTLPTGTPNGIPGVDDLLASALGGGMSPNLRVMSTPPKVPAPEERRRPSRKRKQNFDEYIVLSNDLMKSQLENTDDIRRTRRKAPCSTFELRMAHSKICVLKGFAGSSIPGIATELQEIFGRVFTAQGVRVTFAEDPPDFREVPEELPPYVETPQIPDIEMARFAPPEVEASRPEEFKTPARMGESMYPTTEEVGLGSRVSEMLATEPITEIREPTTAELAGLEFETPTPGYVLDEAAEHVALEEAPSVGFSVYGEEGGQALKFLEEDFGRAAFVAEGEEEFMEQPDVGDAAKGARVDDIGGWSVRTRAVAQYLQTAFEKLHAERTAAKLSLDSILAGRTRKESARMFFETLVLKSKDYIEVEQEAAYADILLSPTPKLVKAKF